MNIMVCQLILMTPAHFSCQLVFLWSSIILPWFLHLSNKILNCSNQLQRVSHLQRICDHSWVHHQNPQIGQKMKRQVPQMAKCTPGNGDQEVLKWWILLDHSVSVISKRAKSLLSHPIVLRFSGDFQGNFPNILYFLGVYHLEFVWEEFWILVHKTENKVCGHWIILLK